ncbi:hypothetical protein J2X12_004129 [Pseudarthrobacter oxydans]|uniref:Phage holin family protein n=1 Tax=Pseudarthrobacter oxydans TaxID=1671 RepID=A0AAW8NI59_PSEOX|nr:hypothetical protein [Pseudarthrobacter oxydans]MDR6794723.1 hypothetical protein [Pseudarthrobacter oxydans]MDR7166075.1 hypothetical protein [Pseudarthrobacter oxydans]
MSQDFEDSKSRELDLENYLRHVRSDVMETKLKQDLERKVESIARSNAQTSTITAFAGVSLALLTALVTTNLGWASVWSNAVLVYFLGFGYISGIFLIGYAAVQQRDGRRRALQYERQAKKSLESQIELMRGEDDLQRIRAEIKSSKGKWTGSVG